MKITKNHWIGMGFGASVIIVAVVVFVWFGQGPTAGGGSGLVEG